MESKPSNLRWISITSLLLLMVCFASRGQFWDSSTGLLQCPSAEMNPSGTLMITNNFLNEHSLSPRWGYNTFGYGFNITFWARLEIGYVLAIFDGKRHPNPSERDLITFNQDRHFTAKFLLIKEKEFGIQWMPALAVGFSDPVTGSGGGEYIGSNVTGSVGNAFFNRYYAVATKHFNTPIGSIGAHIGYQYNKRKDMPMSGPCAAVDWVPVWLNAPNFSLKAIAEYDSSTFNIGFIASIWQDRFEAMFELMALKWVNFGVRYKLQLKS